MAVQEKVPSTADERKFRSIITKLLVKSARAVILFTRADDARLVCRSVYSPNKPNCNKKHKITKTVENILKQIFFCEKFQLLLYHTAKYSTRKLP